MGQVLRLPGELAGRHKQEGAGGTPIVPFLAKTANDVRRRISAPHGLSHDERPLLTEALHYMRRRGPCLFVSIEAGRAPCAEREVRGLARRVRSDIALRQRRAGRRRVLSATVFEALGRDRQRKFGAHIVALMPDAGARDRLVESLNASSIYGSNIVAKPVSKWLGLTTYLLKEATPQAWFGAGEELSPRRRLHPARRSRRRSGRRLARPQRRVDQHRQDRAVSA